MGYVFTYPRRGNTFPVAKIHFPCIELFSATAVCFIGLYNMPQKALDPPAERPIEGPAVLSRGLVRDQSASQAFLPVIFDIMKNFSFVLIQAGESSEADENFIDSSRCLIPWLFVDDSHLTNLPNWGTYKVLISESTKMLMPAAYALCLSRSSPLDVSKAFIERHLDTEEDWKREWNASDNACPDSTADNAHRVSAFEILLIMGSVAQLTMVLNDFGELVGGHVRASFHYELHHPRRVLSAEYMPLAEANEKYAILADFVSQASSPEGSPEGSPAQE